MATNTAQPTLDDFADTLIKDKQYKTLTPEMFQELKLDILQRVHDFLLSKTITKLTDAQAQELADFLDTKPTDEQIQDFIATAIPDASTFIGETLFQFRQIYLGLA
ncbi:MAG: hypothetical protein UX62_C0010G0010 [Microgenomates group bacterium GW2011_GWA2_46_7]|nr:MAG: hypothetical protein UX62_C0010G0010 [Microgenomates group bacterium GW2011_GWA2_46_7]